MPLFKRTGETVQLPAKLTEHVAALAERKSEARRRILQLEDRTKALDADIREAVLEGRFEDHAEAAKSLEDAKAELHRQQLGFQAYTAAETEAANERQRLEKENQLADVELRCEQLLDLIAAKLTELLVAVPALQALASEALAVEAELQHVEARAHELRTVLQQWDEPAVVHSRVSVSRPVTALFASHPEYQMLANQVWHVGVPSPPRNSGGW